MKEIQVWEHYADGALSAPDYIDTRVLAANTVESHTVPAGAKWVVFTADGDFWARYTGTASIAAADITDGTGSELNPVVREISGVTAISLISSAARIISMLFYRNTPG